MIRRIDQNGIISTLLGFNDLTSARPLSCDAVMDISQVRPLWPGRRAPVLRSVERRGTLSAMFPASTFHVVSVSLTCRLAHTFFFWSNCCLRLFSGCTVPGSVHRTWNKTLRLNLDRIYTLQVRFVAHSHFIWISTYICIWYLHLHQLKFCLHLKHPPCMDMIWLQTWTGTYTSTRTMEVNSIFQWM